MSSRKYERPIQRKNSITNKALHIAVVFFTVSSAFFLLLLLLAPSERNCISASNVYRPVMEAINYQWVNFGDYFSDPVKYRGPSTVEREEAWQKLIFRTLQLSTTHCILVLNVDRRCDRYSPRQTSTATRSRWHKLEATQRRGHCCSRWCKPPNFLPGNSLS